MLVETLARAFRCNEGLGEGERVTFCDGLAGRTHYGVASALSSRARIEWLHHHFVRNVTIRTRAKGIVHGKIYRVQPERGATAAYRLEGERNGQMHLFEKDEAVLDGVLASLVEEHDLHPLIRPDVWEGEGGDKPPFVKRDRDLARMTMSGYRGSQPWTVNRHPLSDLDLAASVVLRPFEAGIWCVPVFAALSPPVASRTSPRRSLPALPSTGRSDARRRRGTSVQATIDLIDRRPSDVVHPRRVRVARDPEQFHPPRGMVEHERDVVAQEFDRGEYLHPPP